MTELEQLRETIRLGEEASGRLRLLEAMHDQFPGYRDMLVTWFAPTALDPDLTAIHAAIQAKCHTHLAVMREHQFHLVATGAVAIAARVRYMATDAAKSPGDLVLAPINPVGVQAVLDAFRDRYPSASNLLCRVVHELTEQAIAAQSPEERKQWGNPIPPDPEVAPPTEELVSVEGRGVVEAAEPLKHYAGHSDPSDDIPF